MNATDSARSSQALTMTTRTTTTSLWLLATALVLIILSHEGDAASLQVKQGKPTNSTMASKEAGSKNSTKAKHGGVKVKSSATTTTTVKPHKQETITSKPLDIDVDGRNAYVNNQFISEQEPLPDNTPPLYEILQKQMEKVLSNTGYTGELYAENAQSKEMPEDIQHAPGKPMFSYNLNHFNDYEEEADNENEDEPFGQEEQQQPENCEDTEESLNENDDSNNASQYGNIPTNPSNGYPQNNVPQHSHKPSTGSNKPGKAPYDSSNFNSPSPIYGQSNKPSSSPSSNHQNKPPQSSYGGGQSQQKPSQGNEKPTKPSQTTHHNKPTKPSKQPPSSTSKPNNSKPYMNAEDGADLSNPSSPFSTPNNKPNKVPGKRHMTFRTVSSSTQYVSTPLADLMLKFTLGMAKPGKNQSDLGTQETQVYDKNDI